VFFVCPDLVASLLGLPGLVFFIIVLLLSDLIPALILIVLLELLVLLISMLLGSCLDSDGRNIGDRADQCATAAAAVAVVMRMLGLLIPRSIIVITTTILNTQVLALAGAGCQ
jgi:hypothetical protein